MRRLLAALAAAALAFVAGSLTAHALHAQDRPARWRALSDTAAGGWRLEQLPDSGVAPWASLDSVLAAQGCERRAFSPTRLDSLDRVLVDSGGLRLIEPGSAAGFRRPAGRAAYWVRCPGPDLLVIDAVAAASNRRGLAYARLARYDADSLDRVPPGRYRRVLVSTLDRSRALPSFDVELAEDSLGLLVLGAERAALPRIARRLRADAPAVWDSAASVTASAVVGWRPTLGPILRVDPLPSPPLPPVAVEPCAGAGSLWLDQADVRGHDVERREDVRVVAKSGACVGVVGLRRTSAGDRFVVAYPPCSAGGAWRLFATTYTTRTSAVDRAARGLACPTSPRS